MSRASSQLPRSALSLSRAWKSDRLRLLFLVALGAVFRLAYINHTPPGLWYDEARYLEHMQDLRAGKFSIHAFDEEPVFALFEIVGCAIAGITPLGIRLGAAIAGILTIPAFWWFARPIYGRRTTTIAMLILAILPWHVIFSRIAFRGITLPLFFCLAAGCADRAQRRRDPRWLTLLALCIGVGFYTYLPFVLTLPVLAVYARTILRSKARKPAIKPELAAVGRAGILPASLPTTTYREAGIMPAAYGIHEADSHPTTSAHFTPRSLALCILIFIASLIPAAIIAYDRGTVLHGRVAGENNLAARALFSAEGPLAAAGRTLAMFIWRGDPLARHNPPGYAQLPRELFPFMLIGLVLMFRRARRPRNALALSAFFLFLLPSILSRDSPHALRTIGAIPAACLIIAAGISATLGQLFKISSRPRAVKGGFSLAPSRQSIARSLLQALAATLLIAHSAYIYFVAYGKNQLVWHDFQTWSTLGANTIRELPANATALIDPVRRGRYSFEVLARSAPCRVIYIQSAAQLRAIARDVPPGPLCMLFFGDDTFGEEYLRLFPAAQCSRVLEDPWNRPVGVLFRANP